MIETIIGGAIALFALLAGALGVTVKQRNTARDEAKNARIVAQRERTSREAWQRLGAAQQKAREDAADVQREADSRPDTERPTGHWRR